MKHGFSKIGSVILSLCEIVVGILLLLNPAAFTKGIIIALGIILLLAGIVSIICYFKSEPEEAAIEQGLARGLVEVLAGLFCIFNSGWFIVTFPLLTVVYGIAVLLTGITKIQWMVDMLRMKMKKWGWMAFSAVLTIICAVIILCNPFSSTAVLWMFVAITLIVEAIVDLVAAIFSREKKEV